MMTSSLISLKFNTFTKAFGLQITNLNTKKHSLGRNGLAMASIKLTNHTLNSDQNNQTLRPVANFPPSLWGDHFTSFNIDIKLSERYGEEIEVLKEEARNMLVSGGTKSSEKLILIDTIDRLGLSYHFEEEIQEQLSIAFKDDLDDDDDDDDLYTVALGFRLLRLRCFDVPSSIFKRFTENNGEFKKSLVSDIKGVLSLYEASYLRRRGEEILDKAFSFSKAHLESVVSSLGESPLKKQVVHALEQSIVRGIPRIESLHFISLYGEDESKNESLLRLAKLDFNLLQMHHKNELHQVTRWWKDMDLISRLPYARDRVVECYFWTVGIYSEPEYASARIMLAKKLAVISVIDDTYDAYGTIEELKVFTDAIQKWDVSEIDRLPDYMKICYRALLDLYEAYEAELSPKGRSFAIHYAKDAMKEVVRSWQIEAEWFIEGYLASFDEYMIHARITASCYMLTAVAFFGMDSATPHVYDWLFTKPNILEADVTLNRVIDDMATYEVEKDRGQVSTGIDCYKNEHGVSTQVAMEDLNRVVENGWKDLNEGLLDSRVPAQILRQIFNFPRLLDVSYKHNQDGYTHPEKVLKPYIIALLVDSLQI